METWKNIEGYEGLYMVSNYGNVKSLDYRHTGKECILKPGTHGNGYKQVGLYKNREKKKYHIHRLVAETFIPNLYNYPIINHKDENPSNNCVDNLEWCTHEYNMNYGTVKERIGAKNKSKEISIEQRKIISEFNRGKWTGKKNVRAKKIICITTGEIFDYMDEAVKKYNATHISACCRGERKSAGKHPITGKRLVWKYIDNER